MAITRAFIIFLLGTLSSFCQYNFSGQIPENLTNKTVYLSTISNYRKTARVYADQILTQTEADKNGNFVFTGDNLADENRMYRIHTDDCNQQNSNGSHFFRDCNASQSILFIAKKGDTIAFPLLKNNQSFCTIASTNPSSNFLLDIDGLKEAMLLDFLGSDSKANTRLNIQKWFFKLQNYGLDTKEPLAELYLYAFLSDRKNETYSYYLEELQTNDYYEHLKTRLSAHYKDSSYELQYHQEVSVDKSLGKENSSPYYNTFSNYLLFGGGAVVLLLVGYFGVAEKRKQVRKKSLTVLTGQELNIFNAIRQDKTNKEIASELFISLSTVKTHINSIYKKLDVATRADIKKQF